MGSVFSHDGCGDTSVMMWDTCRFCPDPDDDKFVKGCSNSKNTDTCKSSVFRPTFGVFNVFKADLSKCKDHESDTESEGGADEGDGDDFVCDPSHVLHPVPSRSDTRTTPETYFLGLTDVSFTTVTGRAFIPDKLADITEREYNVDPVPPLGNPLHALTDSVDGISGIVVDPDVFVTEGDLVLTPVVGGERLTADQAVVHGNMAVGDLIGVLNDLGHKWQTRGPADLNDKLCDIFNAVAQECDIETRCSAANAASFLYATGSEAVYTEFFYALIGALQKDEAQCNRWVTSEGMLTHDLIRVLFAKGFASECLHTDTPLCVPLVTDEPAGLSAHGIYVWNIDEELDDITEPDAASQLIVYKLPWADAA